MHTGLRTSELRNERQKEVKSQVLYSKSFPGTGPGLWAEILGTWPGLRPSRASAAASSLMSNQLHRGEWSHWLPELIPRDSECTPRISEDAHAHGSCSCSCPGRRQEQSHGPSQRTHNKFLQAAGGSTPACLPAVE